MPAEHLSTTFGFLADRMVFATAATRDRVVIDYGAIEGGNQTLERMEELLLRQRP